MKTITLILALFISITVFSQDYLYRLSFEKKADWTELRNTLIEPNEDGTFVTKKVATIQLLTGDELELLTTI